MILFISYIIYIVDNKVSVVFSWYHNSVGILCTCDLDALAVCKHKSCHVGLQKNQQWIPANISWALQWIWYCPFFYSKPGQCWEIRVESRYRRSSQSCVRSDICVNLSATVGQSGSKLHQCTCWSSRHAFSQVGNFIFVAHHTCDVQMSPMRSCDKLSQECSCCAGAARPRNMTNIVRFRLIKPWEYILVLFWTNAG